MHGFRRERFAEEFFDFDDELMIGRGGFDALESEFQQGALRIEQFKLREPGAIESLARQLERGLGVGNHLPLERDEFGVGRSLSGVLYASHPRLWYIVGRAQAWRTADAGTGPDFGKMLSGLLYDLDLLS